MKKILALLLILTSLFCLVACGGGGEDGAPEGMVLASDPDRDGYRFYIPQSYLYAEVFGGVLSYVSNVDKSSISIMRVAYDGSIEEYFDAHEAEFKTLYKGYEFKEKTDKPGYKSFTHRYQYNLTYARQNKDGSTTDEHYGIVQLFSKQGDYLYILTYEASRDQNEIIDAVPYEENYESFVSVAKSFVFTEKAKTGGTAAVPNFTFDNGDTPDGMRLASDPALCSYRLYLPKDWKFDVQTNLTSGYVEPDMSSISMYGVIYEEKTYAEYFANVKKELQSVYGADYTLTETTLQKALGDSVTEIGGDTSPYVYLIEGKTPSGQPVRVLRIAIVKGYYVFTFQYTALEGNFDAHLDEVASVVSAFRFKGQK